MKNINLFLFALLSGCSAGTLKLDSIAALSVDKEAETVPFGIAESIVTVSGGVAPYTFETIIDELELDIVESFTRHAANQFKITRPWNSGSATLRVTDAIGNIQNSALTFSRGGFNFVGGVRNTVNSLSETIATQVLRDSEGNFIICGTTTGKVEESVLGKNYGDKDIFLAKISSSGSKMWVTQLEAGEDSVSDNPMIALSSTTSLTYDIFLAGSTNGDFGTGALGTENTFVTKFTSDGVRVWIKEFGGESGAVTRPVRLQFSTTGDVFVTGTTNGDIVEIDGQPPVDDPNDTNGDFFLGRFSAVDGNVSWIVQRDAGVGAEMNPVQMKFSSDSDIWIAGSTNGVIGDQINSHGLIDTYLMKFNFTTGIPFPIKQLGAGGSSATVPYDMIILDDNIYITGITDGDLNVDPADALGTPSIGSNQDAYLVKFASDGTLGRSYQIDGGDGGLTTPVQLVHGSDGVFVLGTSEGDVGGFNLGNATGDLDTFLIKFLLVNGNHAWSSQIGAGAAKNTLPSQIHIESDGMIYVGGTTNGSVLSSGSPIGADGANDAFLVKVDPNGIALEWSRQVGSSLLSTAELTDLHLENGEDPDDPDYVFMLGNFDTKGSVSGAFNLEDSVGEKNSFLVKFNSLGEMQ